MNTFNELYDMYTDITKDSSSTNETRGKDWINSTNQEILGMKEWYFMEKERTASTTADQQEYQIPVDYGRMQAFWTVVGGVTYYPEEVEDLEYWQFLNSTSESSDITTHFAIFDNSLWLYPTPSSTDVTMHMLYRRIAKLMTEADYTTGTLSATTGSLTVTGSGTTWTSSMAGRYVKIGGLWYEINAASATAITLVKYAVDTVSGATYKIGEASPIPGEFHDLLWKGSVANFYDFKGDNNPWRAEYEKRLGLFARQYGSKNKTSNQVIRRVNRGGTKLHDPNDNPSGLS